MVGSVAGGVLLAALAFYCRKRSKLGRRGSAGASTFLRSGTVRSHTPGLDEKLEEMKRQERVPSDATTLASPPMSMMSPAHSMRQTEYFGSPLSRPGTWTGSDRARSPPPMDIMSTHRELESPPPPEEPLRHELPGSEKV